VRPGARRSPHRAAPGQGVERHRAASLVLDRRRRRGQRRAVSGGPCGEGLGQGGRGRVRRTLQIPEDLPADLSVREHPLRVRLLFAEAAQCVGFYLKALHDPVRGAGDGLDRQMSRQSLKAVDEKAQEPREPTPYGAAHAPQGDPLAQQALNQGALLGANQVLVCTLDKLASTRLALMVLFVVVHGAMLLVWLRSARWTRVSHDHGSLLTSH